MKNIQELVNKFNQLKSDEQVYLLDLLQESFILQEENKSIIKNIRNIRVVNFNKREEIEKWLDTYKIKNYEINDDLTVNVNGNVQLNNINLKEILIKFNKIEGDFDCSHNKLKSLEGSPKYIEGECNYSYNGLTSLEYFPKYIKGNFYCNNNPKLTYEYLKDFDFSFVEGYVYTDYSDINDYWNKDK